MRLKITEPSPTELQVTVSLPAGAQFFGSAIGLFFMLVGGAFLFSALPHTDELRLEKRGGQIIARKSQALAGRWELNSQQAALGTNVSATALHREDEGSVFYQVALVGEGPPWPVGKSLSDPIAAQHLVQRLNRFLADSQATRFEWRQRTWWWFLLPFGLAGVAVGLAVVAFFNHQNQWCFRQLEDEVRCRKRFLVFWRTRRWPLHDVKRAVVHRHTDKDGDTFYNVRLQLRSGGSVPMSAASHQMDKAGQLQQSVARLNRFLGQEPQPLEVQDDRPPSPDPAEIERELEQLSTTHPRLARVLGKIAHWTHRKRSGFDSPSRR